MARPINYEAMSREELADRLLTQRAQWRDRAARKRVRDAARRVELGPKQRWPDEKRIRAVYERWRADEAWAPRRSDLIWNRACQADVTFKLAGDRALAAMVAFHGAAMNDGVLYALEHLRPSGLEDVVSAYRFFGLGAVDDLLTGARSITRTGDEVSRWEADLNMRYGAIVPDDATLVARFEAILLSHPSEFAPV